METDHLEAKWAAQQWVSRSKPDLDKCNFQNTTTRSSQEIVFGEDARIKWNTQRGVVYILWFRVKFLVYNHRDTWMKTLLAQSVLKTGKQSSQDPFSTESTLKTKTSIELKVKSMIKLKGQIKLILKL